MPRQELDCKQRARCCHRARPFASCESSQQLAAADTCEEEGFKIPDVPRPGAGDQDIADWAEEVRIGVMMIVVLVMMMIIIMMMMMMIRFEYQLSHSLEGFYLSTYTDQAGKER